MNLEHLCDIAVKATRHTLQYHVGADVFDQDVQALIEEEIHELYPLRTRAQDARVADLEIACDAAITVAEAYNQAVPEPAGINLRWFYHCVQSLLSLEIKPEVLLDGKVDRLRAVQQPLPIIPRSASENESPLPSPSPTLGPDTPASTPEQSPPPSDDSKRRPARTAKAKWEDDEIQLMIELKASGLIHRDVATRLGRGQGSVENKYGRVMHMDEWKDYSSSFQARLRPNKTEAKDDGCQLRLT